MDESFVVRRITELCKKRNWTPYRLSKESGIPASTLHNMLHRSTVPSVPSIVQICRAFKISMAQFFSEGDEEYLSDPEKELISVYRDLGETEQKMALAYMQGLSNRRDTTGGDATERNT